MNTTTREALEASEQCITDFLEIYKNGGSNLVMDQAVKSLRSDALKKIRVALAATNVEPSIDVTNDQSVVLMPPEHSMSDELAEEIAIRERLAILLARTAIALKGEELPLHRHGYHDLPEVATVMRIELDLLKHQVDEMKAAAANVEPSQQCCVNPVSSRMCEMGTKSCTVNHVAANAASWPTVYLVPDYHEPYNGANPVYPRLTLEIDVAKHWAQVGRSRVLCCTPAAVAAEEKPGPDSVDNAIAADNAIVNKTYAEIRTYASEAEMIADIQGIPSTVFPLPANAAEAKPVSGVVDAQSVQGKTAKEYLRGEYGAYCGHYARLELEKAFNAGKAAQPTPAMTDEEVAKKIWNDLADIYNDWTTLDGEKITNLTNTVRDIRAELSGNQVDAAQPEKDALRRKIIDEAWLTYQEKSKDDAMLKSISVHQLRTAIAVTLDAAWLSNPVKDKKTMSHNKDWLLITTAPKNERILLLNESRNINIGIWDDDRYSKKPRPYWRIDLEVSLGARYSRGNPPTHWMPLPPIEGLSDDQ